MRFNGKITYQPGYVHCHASLPEGDWDMDVSQNKAFKHQQMRFLVWILSRHNGIYNHHQE